MKTTTLILVILILTGCNTYREYAVERKADRKQAKMIKELGLITDQEIYDFLTKP